MQDSEVAAGLLPSWSVQDNHPIIQKGAGTHSGQDLRIRRRNPLVSDILPALGCTSIELIVTGMRSVL